MKKRNINLALLLTITIIFSSCMSFYRLVGGMKNPKVETKEAIVSFINETKLNDQYINLVFFDNVKESSIKKIAGNVFDNDFIIYTKEGNRKCYTGNDTCLATQLEKVDNDFENNIKKCKKKLDTINFYKFEKLQDLLKHTINISNGKSLSIKDLPEADYYYVYYWGKYAGTKKNISEDYYWFKDWIEKMDKKVYILKVNCDLRDDWGLKRGKKMKIITKKTGYKKYDMQFGTLPLKNH